MVLFLPPPPPQYASKAHMRGHSDSDPSLIKAPNAQTQMNFATWHFGFVSIKKIKKQKNKKKTTTTNIKHQASLCYVKLLLLLLILIR
jgi:hypothetical protein